MSETVKQFFFFSQKRINFDKTSSALTNMSWYLLHTIFSERKSLSIAAFNLFDSSSFSFHLIGFFKATNNCTRRFTRNNICFKTFSADANTSWYLPHSISSKWQFVSVATINQIQLFHKQSVEAGKRQLRSKVSRHNFFHKNQHLK